MWSVAQQPPIASYQAIDGKGDAARDAFG